MVRRWYIYVWSVYRRGSIPTAARVWYRWSAREARCACGAAVQCWSTATSRTTPRVSSAAPSSSTSSVAWRWTTSPSRWTPSRSTPSTETSSTRTATWLSSARAWLPTPLPTTSQCCATAARGGPSRPATSRSTARSVTRSCLRFQSICQNVLEGAVSRQRTSGALWREPCELFLVPTWSYFFRTARRYASVVYAEVLCWLSVRRLSVTGRTSTETVKPVESRKQRRTIV